IRSYIKNAFVTFIKANYPETEAIAGVATTGIPQGALVADVLNLPFVYVRSEAKKHGLSKQIEGKIQENQKVVVIEDLVSTGGSSLKVVETLRQANMQVLALLSIMTYGFELSVQSFREAKLNFHSLTTYNHILREAMKRDLISEKAMASLQEWRKNPEKWEISEIQ
ncbi:MAG: orotate phosphoribosyltransferase, partial [Raineya sp.]